MADLGCTQNASIAFQYFLGKGLAPIHAAAITGNLQFESGLDPRLQVMDTNKKMSKGIAMWQPPRWAALQTFAAGRDPLALQTQLDFVWAELPSSGLQQLLATRALPDAVVAFQNNFERPLASLAHTDQRIAVANNILTWCANVRPPPPTPRSSIAAVAGIAVGVLAVVATAGYGVYVALGSRKPALAPAPVLPPRRQYPAFRPVYPVRPPPWNP